MASSDLISSPAFKWVVGWIAVSVLALVIHVFGPRYPRLAAFGAFLSGLGFDLPKMGAALAQMASGKASPGLAGVIVTTEKVLSALDADPALASEVASVQAVRKKAADDKADKTEESAQKPAARSVPPQGLVVFALAGASALFVPAATTGCVNGSPSPAVAPIVGLVEQIGCELVAVFTPAPENAIAGTVCSTIASDVTTAINDVTKAAATDAGVSASDAGLAAAFNAKTCKLAPVTSDGVHGQGVVCDVFAPHVNEVLAAKAAARKARK